jgi:hypothetical protein
MFWCIVQSMRPALVASALYALCAASLTGCTPPAPAAPAAPLRSFFGGAVPPLAVGDGARESTACKTDADCVLTCDTDGRCCPQLCVCTHPFNRAFAARLRAHIASTCGAAICPVARCMLPKATPSPVCRSNVCSVRWSDEADASQ